MARPLAETFRESVSHVDFLDDAVLTEPVEMPDSEAGLDYSDYVVRVEDSLDRAVRAELSARGEDLDVAYAGPHGDDVLSSISRDLTDRFLGDHLRPDGDVGLSEVERSGNAWLRGGLKDELSDNLFDMMYWARFGDRDEEVNVGWKFVEDVAACRCLDSGMARHVRNDEERGALWKAFGSGDLVSAAEGELGFKIDENWLDERLWELLDQVRDLASDAWSAVSKVGVEYDEELLARGL